MQPVMQASSVMQYSKLPSSDECVYKVRMVSKVNGKSIKVWLDQEVRETQGIFEQARRQGKLGENYEHILQRAFRSSMSL